MDEPTNEQKQAFYTLTKNGTFCPQCKSEGGQNMTIENPGEVNIQIYCCYCREYIFLNQLL